jgi:hypothetical protein
MWSTLKMTWWLRMRMAFLSCSTFRKFTQVRISQQRIWARLS